MISGRHLADILHKRLSQSPRKTALQYKRAGTWQNVSWQDYGSKVFSIAHALRASGVKRGDRVAILSQTRPEWAYVDQAVLSLGAVTVPVYPTVIAEDVFHILENSGASVVFVEDATQRSKVESVASQLGSPLKFIVSFETGRSAESLMYLNDWCDTQAPEDRTVAMNEWRAISDDIRDEDLATIVYTSGTSGEPKGAELTHKNFVSIMRDTGAVMGITESDVTLLFLPVAHILGRIEQILSPGLGWVNAYAESLTTVVDNLSEVRPTVMVSVPRIFEKIFAAARSKVLSLKGGPALWWWALTVARKAHEASTSGRSVPFWLRAQSKIADEVLFKPVRTRFGGRVRFTISGGAPLPAEIAEFFRLAGVSLFQGYGLTETCGPVAVNSPQDHREGSVGKILPSCQVRIADDGEIMIKGPVLFRGYHGRADLTSESLSADGWFSTGDVGLLDEQGFLFITDRKKDLIITAAGKNIAPQKIENLFAADPLFSSVIVVGDGKKFLGALITLNVREAMQLAKRQGIGFKGFEDLLTDHRFRLAVKARVGRINHRLAPFEAVKRFEILPAELTVEKGELTPSMKVRRRHCTEKYAAEIAALYASGSSLTKELKHDGP